MDEYTVVIAQQIVDVIVVVRTRFEVGLEPEFWRTCVR
jgi:hypothetical protein